MPQSTRLELIQEIEARRKSKVIVVFLGDRPGAESQVDDDLLLPLYDHLLALAETDALKPGTAERRIDLFMYSRGGSVVTPWKLVTKIRSFCDRFGVIIPFRAYSAATMIAMGADELLMSPMSELGPIDPSLVQVGASGKSLNDQGATVLGVEDVVAYVKFMTDRVGISDQAELAAVAGILAKETGAQTLGNVERVYTHIRLVARKLLSLRQPPYGDAVIDAITESLTEKMYEHGHGIGAIEAAELGLCAERMDSSLENIVWSLFSEYAADLKLSDGLPPSAFVEDESRGMHQESDLVSAIIESSRMTHESRGTYKVTRMRAPLPELKLNIGIDDSLVNHYGLDQGTIDQAVDSIRERLEAVVNEQLARLSPVIGYRVAFDSTGWQRV